jgi:phosphatidate cytidylyltransferase
MTGTRVLTALVLIPIVIAVVLYTPTWVVAIALALITVLALREYFALGDAIGQRAYRFWTIFCSFLLIVQSISNIAFQKFAAILFQSPATIFFLFVLGLACLTLWTRRPLVESLPSAGISCSALFLVAFPLSYAVRLHAAPIYGPILLLFALAITWAADTTAYFVGRAIGKHPLAPHISPKKTWEGSFGGLIGSLLVAWLFHRWLAFPLPHLFAMATIGNIAGQMGDLLESACKRSAGVKDSGGLLPGHGGVLDRIDALILCFPVIYYYLLFANPPM